MATPDQTMTLTFRCAAELEGLLPAPTPASAGLPDWLKTMPAQTFSPLLLADDDTVKRCPPFIDAMTSGFLIPLTCDVKVENGAFSWDNDLPPGAVNSARSPIGFHDPSQVAGSPLHDPDRNLIKFHNLWSIEAPQGWSVLFTHPVNRFDLPFVTLTGLVDCDRYHGVPISFPAHWRDASFAGVLPRGTPIAQCFPIRREKWLAKTASFAPAEASRAHDLGRAVRREKGVYRRRFRAEGS
jgi:hypothetical protein